MASFLKKIILLGIFLFLFIYSNLNAQNKMLDSLLQLVKAEKKDTSHINNLIQISRVYIQNKNYNNAKSYSQLALSNSEIINYRKGSINSYFIYGLIYYSTSNYDSSLLMYNKAILNCDSIGNKSTLAKIYSHIGNVHFKKGDYNATLLNSLKALQINEEINNKEGMIACYNGIAAVYNKQNNPDKALLNYLNVLRLAEEVGNNYQIASAYNSIGTAYYIKKNIDQALIYFYKSLVIKEKLGDKVSIFTTLSNLGQMYIQKKKYTDALKIYNRALVICNEIGQKDYFANVYTGIGTLHNRLNNFKESEIYLKKGLEIAKDLGMKEYLKESYLELSNLYEKQSDYKNALNFQKLFTAIKDTIYNTENSKQITEMNTKYETEKKDKELIKKDAEIAMQQVQTEKQAVIKNGFIIGFVFLLILIVFVYRGYVHKQKTNILLNEKNKKIMDSINYAKLIQNSILPPLEDVKKYLPETFVFYQPKDIVSGDFYWFYPINEDRVILAVADCTGHGVPGAFMTMIGHSILSEIIVERKITSPQQILAELHNQIFKKLQQHKGDLYSQDGMDISLVLIDKKENLLHFSAARNNAYLMNNSKVQILKATQKSIGGLSIIGEVEAERSFKAETYPISADSLLILSTDGFFDQFNAEDEKYGTKRFTETILSLNSTNSKESLDIIEKAYVNWKGNNPQQDDVLVFGLKI